MGDADTPSMSSPRPYVSQLRKQQAAGTRQRVVQAAAQLFAEKGYAGTTMPSIARRAGVSTETVQNLGPKVELLRAAIAEASFGATPGAAVAGTDLGARMMAAAGPEEAARLAGELLATVNAGAHGVWKALAEAARTDPVLEQELRRLTAEVAAQNAAVLQEWHARGWLRSDLPMSTLALRATAIGAIELWDRVVRLDGHSTAEYVELVSGLMLDVLTPARSAADG